MPIYEYLCEKCSHEFEREQRITEDPVKTCPKCRGRKVKKLISQTSFVLKGSGWYSDLYSSSKKDDKGDKGDKKSSDKGSSESSESTSDKSKKSDKGDKDSSKSKTSAKSDGKKKGGKKNAA